jgi:hypothetical protein
MIGMGLDRRANRPVPTVGIVQYKLTSLYSTLVTI